MLALADPPHERHLEHRDSCLGRQPGGEFVDAACAQGVADGNGEAGEFVQLAFLQRRVLVDHGLP